MKRSMTHLAVHRETCLARELTGRAGWCAWFIVFGIGCSGCYQRAVVPPTTSIAPPPIQRPVPAPVITPQPTEPFSPPVTHPLDPVTQTNPWRPDSELRDWNYIVLHHTAAGTGSVESIHEEHLKRKDKNGNHWLGIGYHFVIGNGKGMPDGEIEPTFRWRQQMQGAHAGVADYNQHGIGIVLIGNFEKEPPTDAQTASAKRLVGILTREYGISESKVIGHNDVKATECPGKLFPMSDMRDSLAFGYQPTVGALRRQDSGSGSTAASTRDASRTQPLLMTLDQSFGDSRK